MDGIRERISYKRDPDKSKLEGYDYEDWYKEKSSDEEKSDDLSPIPPLEGDENKGNEGE